MKIIKYEVEVSGGVLEWTHGIKTTITEYWIPEHKICFNLYGGPNVFESDEPRNLDKNTEIEVEEHLVDYVLTYWEARKQIQKDIEELSGSVQS